MKAYLSTLNERERWMLIGTMICLILYFYYLFFYAPLSRQVEQKSAQLIEKTATLEWMKKVKQNYRKPKSKETVDNSQLLTILASKLKEDFTTKFPYELQQTGSGDIQLTFDKVAFNSLISWLEKINEQYAITIKQLNADRTPTPGIVHAMVLMSATT